MWTNFLLALIPIVWLIFALAIIKMPAAKACVIGLLLTIILAIFAFKLPLIDTLTGTLEGALMGIWPIVYVIVAALFTYNVSNESGGIKIIQDVLSSITTDQRILVLIIAWGFGGFLEAIAGFGTAVAIPAGILIAFGIEPIKASVICLIANTTPTAFGAIGLPVITLSDVTGLPVNHLSFIVTLQLALLIIIIPFILVGLTDGSFKALKGVFWITLLSGVAFALPQISVAKLVGPELPAIVGVICCIAVTVVMAKMMNKKQDAATAEPEVKHHTAGEFLRASSPFILVFFFVILASSLFPGLHQMLAKVTTAFPVYTGSGAELFKINWLSSPGTLILIATIIGGFIQKMSFAHMMQILWQTIKGIWKTAITICSIVALAKVMGYAGMTAALATALVKVMGPVYPIIAPLIGALGTFITGSDTSANVLFGNLQLSAAKDLAVNKYWLVGSNMVGATAGKMISPQSIAVASAAIGQEGSEATILKQVMKWCLLYLVVICLMLYAMGFITGFL
ncbi:L-lactate permease [Lactobacillus xujianguonis]|uniref:L-lactate permease n=1 Tax=Lactobacillus xujianguonis TaxID=2495899 RepID=UPI000FDAD2FB|nr:L-lactate permease [Lactobacillus xujianguonis]RVU73751.1 L-lactate permease [Lactobacillus xujianguonis]